METIFNQYLNVILRIPSLFVLDVALNNSVTVLLLTLDKSSIIYYVLWSLLSVICYCGSTALFCLQTKHLIKTYTFLAAGGALCVSFYLNDLYVGALTYYAERERDLSLFTWSLMVFEHTCAQVLLGQVYVYCLSSVDIKPKENQPEEETHWHSKGLRSYIFVVLLTPTISSVIGFPQQHLNSMPFIVFLIVMLEYNFVLLSKIPPVAKALTKSYVSNRRFIRHFGIQHFIEAHWTRLNIPTVLRTFWLLRLLYQITHFGYEYWGESDIDADTMQIEYNLFNRFSPVNYENLLKNPSYLQARDVQVTMIEKTHKGVLQFCLLVIQRSLIHGCDTVISLLGMTSILARVAHYAGLALSWFIQSENEEDRSIGTMTAVLFFILALQTGLTTMKPGQRLVRLGRNMCLLTTAILHFIHGMINPLLMNLSASQHHLPHKHIRPLIVCAILIICPLILLYYLWQNYHMGTWLLAVSAFSIEVVIKVFLSLLMYSLFMIDAYRSTFWEGLDDCIYYIKAVGNCIEFVFGIFLFFNGAWILVFESGGTIRAVMMCIHAYFNIWGQAKEGWKTFMRRRNAVAKINSLPSATEEELESLNDVCAICYQDLQSARITRCGHYFHGVCLRKWLYVQDVCPLCHKPVHKTESPKEEIPDGDQPNGEINAVDVEPVFNLLNVDNDMN